MDTNSRKDVEETAKRAEMDANYDEEKADNTVRSGENSSFDSDDSMKDKMQHGMHVAKEKATEAKNTVKEKATEAADTVEEKAQKAKDRAKEMMD